MDEQWQRFSDHKVKKYEKLGNFTLNGREKPGKGGDRYGRGDKHAR